MKLLILLAFVAASQAAAVVYHPGWYGSSAAYKAEDGIGNYAFSHHDGNPGGPSFHSESGDIAGRKVGSYGSVGADGKVRVVDYVADQGGFRANIKSSDEVPKDAEAPAGVTYSQVPKVAYYGHPYGHPYGHYYGAPYYAY